MNRSEVFFILKQYFKIYHTTVNGRSYRKLYTPNQNTVGMMVNDKVYISEIDHIYICNEELVICGKINVEINIHYRDIESLKIYEESDEEEG